MISVYILASISIGLQEVDQNIEREWRTPEELRAHVTTQAGSFDEITISTIGHTQQGQPIQCLEIARESTIAIEDRSAILVVAGIDGNHLLGSEVAIELVAHLLAMDSEATRTLLETHKLFVIPQVNPDVAQHYFIPASAEIVKNNKPVDDDNDGFVDEDSPEDINGDGHITMMRVPDLEKATHIVDPETPRLNATPDALQGTSAEFVLYSEGIDNDNDGKYNEDAIGGVDINKNFMHGYQFHGDGAGVWQLSESESKALADFAFAHQEIAFILVYGQHDTLSKTFKDSGNDNAGAPKTLHKGDVKLYEKVSESFKKFTDVKNTTQPNWDGSFVAWAYAQYGVPAFSTPLWSRPDPSKKGDAAEETAYENGESESSDNGSGRDEGRRPGGMGSFDREAMIAEFDSDGDGELNADERVAFRESMQDRFGGNRPQGGGRSGGRPGGRRAQSNSDGNQTQPEKDSNLTPSGVGDISQETLDELYQAALNAGYPVSEEDMAEITPEQVEQYAKMSGVEIRRVQNNNRDEKPAAGDAAWLVYSDDQRKGEGFIDWAPFNHPQLGEVEIGGWVPYFKTVPTVDVVETRAKEQAEFLVDIANKLPNVHFGTPTVKQLGKTTWEVTISVINDGWFPSGTAMAKSNKRARPFVVRLNTDNSNIITGQKVQRIWSLDGGGSQQWFTWVVQAKPKSSMEATLYSEKFGSESVKITMQQNNGGEK